MKQCNENSTWIIRDEIAKKTTDKSATTDSLMKQSISCIIKGPSASGKRALLVKILNFIPQQDILKFSILTPKALAHFPDDIRSWISKHKIPAGGVENEG